MKCFVNSLYETSQCIYEGDSSKSLDGTLDELLEPGAIKKL